MPIKYVLMLFVLLLAQPGIASESVVAGAAGDGAQLPESAVARRAEERWALLIEGRLESAYQYLSPGYRTINPLSSYARSFGSTGIWDSAEVKDVSCEGRRCAVSLVVALRLDRRASVPTLIEESWVQTEAGGEWWFVPAN